MKNEKRIRHGRKKKNQMEGKNSQWRNGMLATCLSFVLLLTACDDRLDGGKESFSGNKTVPVTLTIGREAEQTGNPGPPAPASRASAPAVMEAGPVAAGTGTEIATKKTIVPPAFYNLEIWQYDMQGNQIGGQALEAETPVGSSLTVSLQDVEICQLFLIARGQNSGFGTLQGKKLSSIQNELKLNALSSTISQAATDDMRSMPYILYLPEVKIEEGKIRNPAGEDVRLLLKRLAVKLTIDWTMDQAMTADGYILKEIRLCQVPADFRLLPKPEESEKWGPVYPSSVYEFVDYYRLAGDELAAAGGTKTVWMPANARGTNPAVTNAYYRNRTYANPSATYVEFVVDRQDEASELDLRLFYRVYPGGNTTTDFNLLENTDYHWTVRINRADYAADPRIRPIDQTPAVSTNLVQTANCLMVKPGSNICFNPYRHTSGTGGWNDYLTDGSTLADDKKIAGVKIVWQTKDAGTTGELVMGYAAGGEDHRNLVNLTCRDGGDVLADTRVHVKLPSTNGGNALIAAYNGSGVVVWSWHLWITDYVPKGIRLPEGYAGAQQQTQNGTVHQYPTAVFQTGEYREKVMMDRNLCAAKGGFPGREATSLEFVQCAGYMYEFGRKDPFFGSLDGTTEEKTALYDADNYPVSLQKVAHSASYAVDGNLMQYTIQHPATYIYAGGSWYPADGKETMLDLWDKGGVKTLYDPCPDGWKVPSQLVAAGMNTTNAYWFDTDGAFRAAASANNPIKGGRLYNLTGAAGVPDPLTKENTAWYPSTSYRYRANGNLQNATGGYIFFNAMYAGNNRAYYLKYDRSSMNILTNGGYTTEAIPVRCVQE